MTFPEKQGSLYWALKFAAERGLKVFPLVSGSKAPRDKQFYATASNQAADIEKLFEGGDDDYNIGVSTEGLLVVDVDVKRGVNGLATFFGLNLPLDTLAVETPTGGFHYYYRAPPTTNTAGKLGPGVDTRGFHGYVIAPGSVHRGGYYTIANDAPIAEAPEWLVQKLCEPRERKKQGFADIEPDDLRAITTAEDYLDTKPGAVEGENGNQYTYDTACRLKDFGVSELTAYRLMSELWNDRCVPPWGEEELERIVGNAYMYGRNQPGVLHPSVEFGTVKAMPIEHKGRIWLRHGEPWQEEYSWLFYQMLPPAGVAVLTGAPGAGKSFVSGFIAEKLATGEPFFGEKPDDIGGTIIVAAEGFSSFGRRLSVLGDPNNRADLPISVTPASNLGEMSSWNQLRADLTVECASITARFDVPVRLIILDTLSAAGLIPDENDNSQCAKAMKKLGDLAAEFDTLVLVLHHPPKTGEGLRGGSALLGSADYVLAIKPEPGKKAKKLVLDKARDAEAPRGLGGFLLKQVVTGEDRRGRPITTAYIEASEHAAYKSLEPVYFEDFMEGIKWARADTPGLAVGDPVPLTAVQKQFRVRQPRASAKQFGACQTYAVEAELIEIDGPLGDELVRSIGDAI